MNTTSVDAYLQDGCGRCDDYQTPRCKVHLWTPMLVELRTLALAAGLTETMKWGSPCYTVGGKNVSMILSFREACGLSFFKGALITDPDGVLERTGPNSNAGRYVKLRSMEDLAARRAQITGFLDQAVALERQGAKVAPRTEREPLPEELGRRMEADPALHAAWDALTPGRQRSHILHVSGAKQADTRDRRAERCAADILEGRGFNER